MNLELRFKKQSGWWQIVKRVAVNQLFWTSTPKAHCHATTGLVKEIFYSRAIDRSGMDALSILATEWPCCSLICKQLVTP